MSRWSSSLRTTRLVVDAVRASGLPERLLPRRPRDLAGFLAVLQAAQLPGAWADPDLRRDALVHLGSSWSTTCVALARPDSLPEVVQRRTRVRVHPAAPWATAGVAATGAAAVVAGPAAPWLEGLGVIGVAAVTALASGLAWRPRARSRDRRYTLTGPRALAARGDAVLSLAAPPADLAEQHELDRRLAVLHGSARAVEAVEHAARESGLLAAGGDLAAGPRLPAQQHLADELVLARARLVQGLLSLQDAAHRVDARQRVVEQQEYTRIVDDLHPRDDTPDV